MSELVVRAYNVGFGDALLVSIPEVEPDGGEVTRHLLIDVGNLLAGDGNTDEVFATVVHDVADRTGGVVDLYVLTHEHLDHAQGLLAAHRAGVPLRASYAWLTGSAHPDYYETHPDARKRRLESRLALEDAIRVQAADNDPWLAMMIRNNTTMLPAGSHNLSTADYVDHVRRLTDDGHTHYVDRTTDVSDKHPFREASIRVLAPEEDTSLYYRRRSDGGSLTATGTAGVVPGGGNEGVPGLEVPPPGVDPAAFFDLVAARRRTTRTRILEIDAANNNTSLVLEIAWRGWRLLFPGDAELRSWRTMQQQGLLRPVHLVKVSHHGSHNGTDEDHLDTLIPPQSHDGRPRHALVSTHDGDWDSVPDRDTLSVYASRCILHDTRQAERGAPVEIRFPA